MAFGFSFLNSLIIELIIDLGSDLIIHELTGFNTGMPDQRRHPVHNLIKDRLVQCLHDITHGIIAANCLGKQQLRISTHHREGFFNSSSHLFARLPAVLTVAFLKTVHKLPVKRIIDSPVRLRVELHPALGCSLRSHHIIECLLERVTDLNVIARRHAFVH